MNLKSQQSLNLCNFFFQVLFQRHNFSTQSELIQMDSGTIPAQIRGCTQLQHAGIEHSCVLRKCLGSSLVVCRQVPFYALCRFMMLPPLPVFHIYNNMIANCPGQQTGKDEAWETKLVRFMVIFSLAFKSFQIQTLRPMQTEQWSVRNML